MPDMLPELTAMQKIIDAIADLKSDEITRVLTWACRRQGITVKDEYE